MTAETLDERERDRLMDAAREATERAYAPWSGFAVGAALLTDSGEIYRGCNVENSSFGLTMCAERVAVFSAVAAEGSDRLSVRALAIASRDGRPCSPCGACRQVLAELAPDAIVVFRDEGKIHQVPVAELLPHSFELPK